MRNLYLMEEGKLYEYGGRRIPFDGYADLVTVLRDNLGVIFTGSLSSYKDFPFLAEAVRDSKSKCICTKRGSPQLVRISTRAGSRWVISADSWNDVVDMDMLDRMWDVYEHFGVGFAPTMSSLGVKYMRYVWNLYGLRKHSALPLSCENFIKRYSPSAFVHTERLGEFDTLEYADMTGAYLSKYVLEPDGPATFFKSCMVEDWATYFARCTIEIQSELALGPFPNKMPRGSRKKYGYPVLPGVYKNVYIWKEQVRDCIEAGCKVSVHEGWAWNEFTTDNLAWVQHAFDLRQSAPTPDAKKKAKACCLAVIGHMGMDRTNYILIENGGDRDTDRCLVDINHDPIDLWIREEYDSRSAVMNHWWDYTRQMTSHEVYRYALPFAQQGRLIAVDHDMILVLEDSNDGPVVRKYSAEAAVCPPGTWLWQLIHNVSVIGHRRFKSDEITHLPGIHRELVA